MQKRKSSRHVKAANARWRAVAAQAERDSGIPDREVAEDQRQPFDLDLRSWGGPVLHIEPRRGYIAARAIDESGQVVACAALKTLLHRVADSLPRTASA